jgi:hypothetical protein
MKRTLYAILFGGVVMPAAAQTPIIDSWMLNTTGTAVYNVGAGNVNMTDSADITKVCYDANYVYVKSRGLANYVMGPFPGNPNTPSGQNLTWKIKRNPSAATTHTDQPSTGPLGASVNGVALYGISDARSYDPISGTNSGMGAGVWNTDAWVTEGSTMDANGNGHPQQMGQYHYHACPISLYTDPSSSHSPIIGWAFDGYPIYGPFGYTNPLSASSGVSRMQSSYQLRSITVRTTLPDGSTATPPGPALNATYPLGTYIEDYEYVNGSGTLDEYNGRYCVTPDFPGGVYAYFIATDSNGDPDFPYLIGLQYYGTVTTMEITGGSSATVPGSAVCFTPQTAGVESMDTNDALIYPNPANEVITLNLLDGTHLVTITDMQGRAVLTQTVGGGTSQLNTAHLDAGVYTVTVTGANNITYRLVVSH